MPRTPSRTIAALLLAIVLAIVGCDRGGHELNSTTPGAAPLFDPASADALAHAALMAPQGMPGGDWVVIDTDYFLESFEDDTQPAECQASEEYWDAKFEPFAAAMVGRGAHTYAQADAADAEFERAYVNIDVMLYPTDAAASQAVQLQGDILGDETLGACSIADMRQRVEAGAEVSRRVERVAFDVRGVQSSATYILEATGADGPSLKSVRHQYNWRQGNAVVGLTAFGTDFTAEMARAAVRGTQQRLELLSTGVALDWAAPETVVDPNPVEVSVEEYRASLRKATLALAGAALVAIYPESLESLAPELAASRLRDHYNAFRGTTLRYLTAVVDAGIPQMPDGPAIADGIVEMAARMYDTYRDARQRAGQLPTDSKDELMTAATDIARDVVKGGVEVDRAYLKLNDAFDLTALRALSSGPADCGGFGRPSGMTA